VSDQGRAYWDNVYVTKDDSEVSWFQQIPATSLALIDLAQASRDAAIIDIGGGASHLVDHLLSRGYRDVTVLDVSEAALSLARVRLTQPLADHVNWIVADVTQWQPPRQYDLWHDRAAFHFLVDATDRAAYVTRVKQAVAVGGHVVIGTFAIDGPGMCSGLPVRRYDADGLAAELGDQFTLIASPRAEHVTPHQKVQPFQFCLFRRVG